MAAPIKLTGRVDSGPSRLLHDEILEPQFRYETEHLLKWYVLIEKILLLEYRRLGLIDERGTRTLAGALHELDQTGLEPDPKGNLSDPAFAIERAVTASQHEPVVAWHVDRSRNDLQATAQLMAAREWMYAAAEELLELVRVTIDVARRFRELTIPGYTQLQAAQVMSPGFYLAALADRVLGTLGQLLDSHDRVNLSPLGAGALTGQEVPFDRERMAWLGGFSGPRPHALVAVASRDWALRLAADVAVFGVTLSRFTTDLMDWGSGDRGLLVLPDRLCGISSAMPQKRNHPVLERIRGRTAHLSSCFADVALAQRNTPFTNMVEVSKESTSRVLDLFRTLGSVSRLLRTVLGEVSFDVDRARKACGEHFLGGFTLANQLTLGAGVPWRQAQVIAGRYITAAIERGARPSELDPAELATAAAEDGFELADPETPLRRAFHDDPLRTKVTAGSTHPEAVSTVLDEQSGRLAELERDWRHRSATVREAVDRVDAALGLDSAKGRA